MRILIGARPHVHVFEVIVLTLESKGPGFSPCPDDQIMRFDMPFVAECRVGRQ